jgi:ferredoxin
MFQHTMFVDSNRDCVLCLDCVRLCPNGSPQLNIRAPARELWTTIGARSQVASLVVLLLGLLLGQTLIQFWESETATGTWGATMLESHRVIFVTVLLCLTAALPFAALKLSARRFDREPGPYAKAFQWQRLSAWAPLMGAGYAAYQFGNIPALDRLRLSLGGLAILGLPEPLLSLRVLPLIQASALAVGLTLTTATLSKIWPKDESDHGHPWLRGQAISLGAATTYSLLLLLVMVVRPQWTMF